MREKISFQEIWRAKKEDIKKPIGEEKPEPTTETVPEKRKRDDEPEQNVAQDQDQEPPSKEEQSPPKKAVKEDEDKIETKHEPARHEETAEKVPSTIAHKILHQALKKPWLHMFLYLASTWYGKEAL